VTVADEFIAKGPPTCVDELSAGKLESLAELMELVVVINKSIELSSGVDVSGSWARSDLLERLKEWLDKIGKKLAEIAEELKAASYSLAVGFPGGVTISIAFASSK
jgi:hypothetical protein